MKMTAIYFNEIHKDMSIAKYIDRQSFNLVNALFTHYWTPVINYGVRLMDALLNYPCFTFQNEKY